MSIPDKDIYWYRIDKQRAVKSVDNEDFTWNAHRTGRIGLVFIHERRLYSMGSCNLPCIELYDEIRYDIKTHTDSKDDLVLENARKLILMNVLFPGLDDEIKNRFDYLIRSFTVSAAEGKMSSGNIHDLFHDILMWAIHHDDGVMAEMKMRFPEWVKENKQMINTYKPKK